MNCLKVARFIHIAEQDAKSSSVVIMGQTGGARHNNRYGWTEMKDPKFREAVLKTLHKRQTLKDPHFSPPDDYDDWTFYAYPK